ncbi:MAG: hypothetical protein IPL55_21295 [Saprospiraceae bacterium]|jgi:hypothetical protein|nr:hypothetical protein [Saprospiraceae bacterium]MBL0026619.1 hypothetical protein [Saprospiraceae bacterium]
MSEESKPYIIDEKTQRLRDIIDETEAQFNNEIKVTPGEAKRIELIRKMKQDTDKKDYMIMFNILMISLSLISLAHFALFGTVFSLVCLMFCILYFVFIRKRLTSATLQLGDYKNNFDRYLWEGFYLKEMRFSAVKLAYMLFFPFFVVFAVDLIRGANQGISFWIALLIAAGISSGAWIVFFHGDKDALESIESDLRSLDFL